MRYTTAISILMTFVLAFASSLSFAGNGQGGGGASAGHGQQIDRDRTNIQDPSKIKDQDNYGNELMTSKERKQYRKELGKSDSQGSQKQFQTQHAEKMQERALQHGQDLVPPGQGPVYGGEFMTVQKRNQYREQLRLSDSESERQQLQAQHRDQVNQRSKALGFEVEEVE